MRYALLFFGFFLGLTFNACQHSSERYATVIAGIDSLLTQLDSANVVFNSIPKEEVNAAFNQMNDDLKFANWHLHDSTVTIEEATLFSEYNSARRLVKDFPQRMRTLPQEHDRTLHQLESLKKALETGATEDQLGNKIDKAYVDKQYSTERQLAENLVMEMKYTEDYASKAMKAFRELEPRVRQQIELWRSEQ